MASMTQRKGLRMLIYGGAAAILGLLTVVFSGVMVVAATIGVGVFALLAAMDKNWTMFIVLGAATTALALGAAGFIDGLIDFVGWAAFIGGGIASVVGYRGYKGKKQITS